MGFLQEDGMRRCISLCLLLLLMMAAVSAVNGYFENPEYPADFIAQQEQMLKNVEQLFPRIILRKTFDGTNKPVVTKPEPGYYSATREINGKRERMLAAFSPAEAHHGWGEHFFNVTGSFENFYLSIEAQIIERDDSGNSYLWIQYTDDALVGESGRTAVTINFPVDIDQYETVGGERVYTTRYDLSRFADDYEPHKFEIIRLDGYVSYFIDGSFITGFEDGFDGRFYPLFGTGLDAGGLYVTAQFDNFTIRIQSY